MIKKSKTSDLILPGKSYFLKNPDGFVFTYLFASGASQDVFVTLLKKTYHITPVSVQTAPMKHIHSLGKCIVSTVKFPSEFPGTLVSILPSNSIKKMTAKTGSTFEELLNTIYESIAPNLSKLVDTSIPPLSISSKYADTSKYPVSDLENCLWIKHHWEIAEGGNSISLQCISHKLLSSFCIAMLGEELSEQVDDLESLLGLIRKLNKRFQEWLFSSISSDCG